MIHFLKCFHNQRNVLLVFPDKGLPLSRQQQDIDIYGHAKGEILAAIDLYTREVLLWFLQDRKLDTVALENARTCYSFGKYSSSALPVAPTTAQKLNQAGKAIDESLLKVGGSVYFYRPPSQNDVLTHGGKKKHLFHYLGPAKVIRLLRNRQYEMEYTYKTRDSPSNSYGILV